jgi:pSer/pThr/pTyr-binding forkhead associated (FHA) protein
MVMAGPDGFVLRDLESKCGTFVNDKRIEECSLNNGDRIRIGEVQLVFKHS